MKNLILFLLASVMLAASASAAGLVVSDVLAPELAPGAETLVRIEIENTFDRDIEDVSFSLNLQDLPLAVAGSSEATIEEIEDDDAEEVVFRIRASPTAKPGDYQIPFTLTHRNANATQVKAGMISLRVTGTVELAASFQQDTPVIGRTDRLSLKLINKGFADARYVIVRLQVNNLVLTSDDVVYIGDISANDFETATFDVRYTKEKPLVAATIEYRDFNNVLQTLQLQEQLTVYTEDEGRERGIIERSKTPMYITLAVILLAAWFIWRMVRRRRRLRRSTQAAAARE